MTIKIVYMFILGLWAAVLANKNIAVYHDGIRPIMGTYVNGTIKKSEMIAISFAMSIGLIIGFGIPFSISSNIILIHSILLATDVIGIASPNLYVAGGLGGLFGVGLTVGLEVVVKVFKALPVNIMDGLSLLGDPVTIAFSVLPAVAIGYQFGYKKGLGGLLLSGLARVLTLRFLKGISIGESKVSISPDGMALAAGMILLIALAIMKDRKNSSTSTVSDNALFSENAEKIKKNRIPLMIGGALISLGASLLYVGGSPLELAALQKGQIGNAALVSFINVIGYMPLVVTTGLVSGVWATGGICNWLFGIGYLSPTIVSPFVGALGMGVEVYGVKHLAKFMDKYPSIREAGDHIRTAMTQVLEIALLVGGMIAANAMAPTIGFFVVAGVYIINIIAGTKIVKMAVGPLAAIFVGVLANILKVLGLM